MLVERNDVQKWIDVWMKKDETDVTLAILRQHFPDYFIFVWHSGNGDLAQHTAELLRSNLENNVAADA